MDMKEPIISLRSLDAIVEHMRHLPDSAPIKAEALSWLRFHRTRVASPTRPHLVFDLSAPGYVRLGPVEAPLIFCHPGLAGIDYAWHILLAGPGGSSYLHATTLLAKPGKQPGGALRNRLREAAEWVETVGRCAPLAVAFRSPCIRVSDEGEIQPDPALGPLVEII
jgi:hypothetical protein